MGQEKQPAETKKERRRFSISSASSRPNPKRTRGGTREGSLSALTLEAMVLGALGAEEKKRGWKVKRKKRRTKKNWSAHSLSRRRQASKKKLRSFFASLAGWGTLLPPTQNETPRLPGDGADGCVWIPVCAKIEIGSSRCVFSVFFSFSISMIE